MVPRSIAASRIWSQGDYAGMIGRGLLDALKAEAEDARPLGQPTILPISDRTEDRGGSPARSLRSAPCREVHWALHASQQLTNAVADDQVRAAVGAPPGAPNDNGFYFLQI